MKTLRIEGNNGGDYFEIEPIKDNLVRLRIGHCCVVSIDHIVPVEFITATLTESILRHDTVQDAIRAIAWSEDFTNKLADQVHSVRDTEQETK